VLRLPRNLFRLFGDALLASAQSVPDTGWATIAPCGFNDDSSQVRVSGFSDASASRSLATGIFAGHSTAITHQLPSTAKARYLAQFSSNGHSRISAIPRSACRSLMTCCNAGEASFTASVWLAPGALPAPACARPRAD
jgi:hypothetical protein